MARPTKTGLEYFPLDVDMDQDDKLFFIEAKHGLIGFAIVVRLLMLIYKEGYYKQYTEDKEAFMIAKRLSVDVNVLKNVINDCINEGIFNKNLFEHYGILTSRGIQKRYLEACGRRKEVNMVKEYCLISPKNYKNVVFEHITPVNVDINPDKCNTMPAETPQSKVKESKVKENIKHICASEAAQESKCTPEGDGVEAEKVTATSGEQRAKTPFASKKTKEMFDAFWREYPKRRAKGNAEKAFAKIKPSEQLFEAIMNGLKRAKTSEDWQKDNGKYIPYPATWLNGKRWEDEYTTSKEVGGNGNHSYLGGKADDEFAKIDWSRFGC